MLDILIADDHSIVRYGLSLVVRQALGEACAIDFATSGKEVLDRLRQKKYDLLLSDLMMPDRRGVALIGQALAVQPKLRIIIISVGPERHFSAQCLQSGAYAYINKGASDLTFARIIRSVAYDSQDYHAHNRKMSTRGENVAEKNINPFGLLSQREHEVIMLLLRGYGMMEIAKSLSISPSAASTLKGRAFTKLSVRSVVELSRLAYHEGVHPDGTILS